MLFTLCSAILMQLNCLEISCRYKEKGTGKTGRRKGLFRLCMGLGKFHNWKPFLKSESHLKDSWLSWEGRRNGGSSGASDYVCFCQQGAPRAKQVLWHWRLALHLRQGIVQRIHCVSVSCILFYVCPHSQTFCPMLKSDYAKCSPHNYLLLM